MARLTDDFDRFDACRQRLARAMCAADGKDPDGEYGVYDRNAVDDDGSPGRVVLRRVWQDYEDRAGHALCCMEDAGMAVVGAAEA